MCEGPRETEHVRICIRGVLLLLLHCAYFAFCSLVPRACLFECRLFFAAAAPTLSISVPVRVSLCVCVCVVPCSVELQDRMAPSCALPLVLGLVLLLLPASDASLSELRSGRVKVSSPEEVVRLLKDHAITRLRLYDANHSLLRALGNSSINVIVGVHSPGEVEDLGRHCESARVWVERNIAPFVEDTNVTGIAVGDERPLPITVQAVRNLRHALVGAKLGDRIEVDPPRSVAEPSFASLTPDEEQGFVLVLNEDLAKRRRWLADERGFVWCVVIKTSDVYAVQSALNWACERINCGPTYVGGNCFLPNTIWDHASWAFNAYYNSMNGAQDACNFSGTAYVTSNDPSSEQCFYQGTSRALAVNTACTRQGQTAILSIVASLIAFLVMLVVL